MTPKTADATKASGLPKRRLLHAEGVAFESLVGVSLALVVLADWSALHALIVGVLAAVLVVATVEGVLLRNTSDEALTLDCITATRFNKEALKSSSNQEGETHLFGLFLVVVFMPFIAAFVIVRIAFLYIYPITAIAVVAIASQGTHLVAVVAVVAASIGLAILNEFVVTRPLAKRWEVSVNT